ncbi:MAG: M6 family metalloprotease domain-containing protein [Clostridia bacterium]|nr:M6 family metalloprotease domain-containing protein [Clostridia bacterium]
MLKIKHFAKMTGGIIAFSLTLLLSFTSFAAPVTNLPTAVSQPNGEELSLFVSGDEYFNYLHDADGNIIMQNYDTGYYTYAKIENGKVIAGDVTVTYNSDEGPMPVNPSTIIFEDIPESYIQNICENSPLNNNAEMLLNSRGLVNERKTHPFLNETVNNIVIFIDFPDVTFNSSLDAEYFNSILNTNDNSLKSWFDTASYGKTSLVSHLYPTPDGTMLATYTDIYPRTTYQVHHKDANGNDVYELNGKTISRTALEHDLLQRAVNEVSSQISEELNIDIDENNYVDSVTFIIAGNSGAWNTLLWSHQWSMSRDAKINGKKVSTYTFIMENEVRPNGRYDSVLQHELFHLYGAPDLYHYKSGYGTVVGRWDNMDSSAGQMTCMYLKYKYGNWIDEIPEIKDDTLTYTINKNTLPANNCYVLRSPYSANEFFVVEYRKKEAPFEDTIPGDGVVIFRIDSRFNGNSSYNGTTRFDEVFVSQNPPANSARYPYYSDTVDLKLQDGTDAGITLNHFVLSGDTASFKVSFTYDKLIDRFMDKRVADAVCAQLNKSYDEVTAEDLQSITSITLNPIGTYDLSVDLDGIEYLTNLQSLIMNDCKISDISALSSLTHLEHLELKDNEIEDFSPLENLTSLQCLKIRGNISNDYSAVAEYYNSIAEKDFSLNNQDDIVFRVPDFNTENNIGDIRIECSETVPEKIHITIEKYAADGTLLTKSKHENFSWTQSNPTLYVSSDFNCNDGAYIVISAYERRRFSKLISKCTIKPVAFDFTYFE